MGKMSEVIIQRMEEPDWPEVARIFNDGVSEGDATFETGPPTWSEWDELHLSSCRLVAREGRDLMGWAALSPVSSRCVYGGVGEVSVYVDGRCRRKGIGFRLLEALVRSSEEAGLWSLQAGIFPENVASIELHRKCGFRVVGVRHRLGKLNGVWRDVVLLERRSSIVGAG